MLKIWEMQSTPSLLSLPIPLRLGVVAPDRVPSMSQTELNCVLMLNELFEMELFFDIVCMLNWIVRNRTLFDIETVNSC